MEVLTQDHKMKKDPKGLPSGALEKIFICGMTASGKGLTKQLLDGHSRLLMVPVQGFLLKNLIEVNLKTFHEQRNIAYRPEFFSKMPFFTLQAGQQNFPIYLHEFMQSFYHETSLFVYAHAGFLWADGGKAKERVVDFKFDYSGFSSAWYQELFIKSPTLTIDQLIDLMYQAFLRHWQNKYRDLSQIHIVTTTVPNGIKPIRWLLDNTCHSKFLIMKRDPVAFSYAMSGKHFSRARFRGRDEGLVDLAVIRAYREFLEFIQSPELRTHPRVMIVDFEKLVLDTSETMKRVAVFLDIPFEESLLRATLNRVPLDSETVQFTGKINEDPYEALRPESIRLLKYLYEGADPQNGFLTNVSLGLQAGSIKAWEQFQKILNKTGLVRK